MTRPFQVSVVIPTFDRCERLAWVLDGVASQELDDADVEVIVVSDGCTDGTEALLERWADGDQRRVVRQSNGGPAVARNTGASHARSDLLVFLDDDVVPSPVVLGAHLAAHRGATGPIASFGPMVAPPGPRPAAWVRWEHEMLERQYEALRAGDWAPSPRNFYSGNAAVPRASFERVGGFDPARRRAEDTELAYRLDAAGVGFVFVPDAVGHHHVERSRRAWLAIPEEYGRSDADVARRGEAPMTVDIIAAEFGNRHRATRAIAHALVGRRRSTMAVSRGLVAVAEVADRVGARGWSRGLLSTAHNLRYYHGVAGGLGGRRAFLDRVGGDRAAAIGAAGGGVR